MKNRKAPHIEDFLATVLPKRREPSQA